MSWDKTKLDALRAKFSDAAGGAIFDEAFRKVGDKILFAKYSGSEIKLDGEEHLIMREEDILGVIEG